MLFLLLLLMLFPLSASAEYLGILSANPFDSASTSNPFGAESPFKPGIVNNSSSPHGSPFNNQSATNPFATNTPQLYDQEINYRSKLRTNPYDPDSVSNPYGRYGRLYSSESLNNPYGAGNSYRSDSPTNPYGSGGRAQQSLVAIPRVSAKDPEEQVRNLYASGQTTAGLDVQAAAERIG